MLVTRSVVREGTAHLGVLATDAHHCGPRNSVVDGAVATKFRVELRLTSDLVGDFSFDENLLNRWLVDVARPQNGSCEQRASTALENLLNRVRGGGAVVLTASLTLSPYPHAQTFGVHVEAE